MEQREKNEMEKEQFGGVYANKNELLSRVTDLQTPDKPQRRAVITKSRLRLEDYSFTGLQTRGFFSYLPLSHHAVLLPTSCFYFASVLQFLIKSNILINAAQQSAIACSSSDRRLPAASPPPRTPGLSTEPLGVRRALQQHGC